MGPEPFRIDPGRLEKLQRHKVSARELDFDSRIYIFRFSVIFEVQISKPFSKKSNPCGPSGQIPRGKRILYRSSPCQVFVTFGQKYWFLQAKSHFFIATLFPPYVRLRPVQEGFCVLAHTPTPDVIGKSLLLENRFFCVFSARFGCELLSDT